MNSSMINAMMSMHAMQRKIDLIADNIANLNTAGYKRKTSSFEELLTTLKQQDGRFAQAGRLTPLGFTTGWGVRMTQVLNDLTQGPIQTTGNTYDLAIQGRAFFEVIVDGEGTRAYTRNGAFRARVNEDGNVVVTTADGYPLVVRGEDGTDGPLVLPAGYGLQVDAWGAVRAVSPDHSEVLELGRLRLVEPARPEAFTAVADNLYAVADGVDPAEVLPDAQPDENNDLRIVQGALEQSNVDLQTELTELLMAQRAYQLSARAVQSADTMMSLANQLRA
jgi:flagellar basal-body rod protein FlgG